MTLEVVPAGQVSDGFGLVLFVPTIANPAAPTVAELTAAGVKKLTYSIQGDGYKHDVSVNTVTSERLTLRQAIQYDGTVTDDLEITFVYTNSAGDVVRLALPTGQAGFIVERWAVDNSVAIATAQLVDVVPIQAGLQRKNAPAKNAELTRTQKLNVTGTVMRDVAVV